MFKKMLIGALLAGALAAGAFAEEVIIRVGPPHPVYERRIPPPGPGYYWTPGYHRWDGNRYVWVGGRWVLPPRHHAHWERAHYVRRHGGWVFVEGHWR